MGRQAAMGSSAEVSVSPRALCADSASRCLQSLRGAQRAGGAAVAAPELWLQSRLRPGCAVTECAAPRPRGSEKDAAQLIRTIVSVVAHCHHLGVIHRCAALAVPSHTLAPAAGTCGARARGSPGAAPHPSRGACVCKVPSLCGLSVQTRARREAALPAARASAAAGVQP